jgi:hypothetical protein
MRFIIAPEFQEQMLQEPFHPNDCFVRPGEYLHHMYIDGVKYVVVPALIGCIHEATEKGDEEALRHLHLHYSQFEVLHTEATQHGNLDGVTLLGDPPPDDDEAIPRISNPYLPQPPQKWEDLSVPLSSIFDLILRLIFTRGQLTGGDIASELKIPYHCLSPLLPAMRKQGLIDITGQKGQGDAGMIFDIKPPKGAAALQDALSRNNYVGPCPVPFDDYVESVLAQSIKKLVVTRRSIQKAFEDLVISEDVFNEIGPAVNSASSIFFFGFPGNGKTSIAERITRLMGDDIYIPYAIDAGGQLIKLYDPVLHVVTQDSDTGDGQPGMESILKKQSFHDQRYVRIRRPTIVVGGELMMGQLDLKYNENAKVYDAPLQMKANGGIFMIDDFGRQQIRPMDLLNRWIVPLEKRYDYLSTVTGTKVEVPFDQLLIFSTNLDPSQLADEAFLRRIKFKIEIRDPDENQFRQIFQLVCKGKRVEYDDQGIDYLINKWYKPKNRPFRMCQPRDLIDQMMSLAKYNMERVCFTPDLIDAACSTYFVDSQGRSFGAQVRLA